MRWPRPFLAVLLVVATPVIPAAGAFAHDGGDSGKHHDAQKNDDQHKGEPDKDRNEKDKDKKDKAKPGTTPDVKLGGGQRTAPAGGGLPPAGRAVLGRAVAVAPVRGVVRVRLPGAKSFVVLSRQAQLPTGATVDTGSGAIALTTASNAKGAEQSATFSGAAFSVTQRKGVRPMTELVLRGGDFAGCRRSNARRHFAMAARSRGPVRRLWGSGHGRFRTQGRYGSATVRGTVWLTEDRCDGTRVRVARGLVAVRDQVRRKTVSVPAGHSYLARARP